MLYKKVYPRGVKKLFLSLVILQLKAICDFPRTSEIYFGSNSLQYSTKRTSYFHASTMGAYASIILGEGLLKHIYFERPWSKEDPCEDLW